MGSKINSENSNNVKNEAVIIKEENVLKYHVLVIKIKAKIKGRKLLIATTTSIMTFPYLFISNVFASAFKTQT